MDVPLVVPVSPGTPTNTTPNRSSCSASGYGTPNSSRSRTRKVARTPSKQREETEPFDSLLESFIQGLQDGDSDQGVKTLLTSTTLHNEESSRGRTVQHAPIKLEDLFSDSEMEGREGTINFTGTHCLQLLTMGSGSIILPPY